MMAVWMMAMPVPHVNRATLFHEKGPAPCVVIDDLAIWNETADIGWIHRLVRWLRLEIDGLGWRVDGWRRCVNRLGRPHDRRRIERHADIDGPIHISTRHCRPAYQKCGSCNKSGGSPKRFA